MSHQSDLIATDIDAYLAEHEQKELLRFLTCGSVDDGKSTLIGRLLYDSKMIYEDRPSPKIQKDSLTHGTTGDGFRPGVAHRRIAGRTRTGHHDRRGLSLFLHAEDVSSSSPTRPATSSIPATWRPALRPADLAIILIDARHGVVTQTKRHSFITSLLGIKHVLVADQQDGPGRLGRKMTFNQDQETITIDICGEDGRRTTFTSCPCSALQGR